MIVVVAPVARPTIGISLLDTLSMSVDDVEASVVFTTDKSLAPIDALDDDDAMTTADGTKAVGLISALAGTTISDLEELHTYSNR